MMNNNLHRLVVLLVSTFKMVPFVAMIYWLATAPILSAAMLVLFLIADVLDGMLFRMLATNDDLQFSQLRRWYDAISDRIVIHVTALSMIYISGFPPIVYAVVLTREVLLACIMVQRIRMGLPVPEPNWLSRLGTLAIGLMAFSWLIVPSVVLLLILTVPMALLSWRGSILYIRELSSK